MKLITIKSLELWNWMGYKGKTVLDFEGKDITGVLAEYVDNPIRSNRGGKTSILEAFGYNMTGLSRTKDEVKLIHHGETEMYTLGVYTDGEKDYKLKRGRDHKGKGILELDWIQKNGEVEDEIEKLFGITAADFYLTSYFKQSDTEGFMQKKPADKAQFLMKWINNEHWKEKEKRAGEDRKIVKQKLTDNENLKKALEASLEVDESLSSMIYEINKETEDLEKVQTSVNEELATVNVKLRDVKKNRQELRNKITELKAEYDNLSNQLASLDKDTVAYQKLRRDYSELKKQNENLEIIKDKQKFESQHDEFKQRKNEINNALEMSKKYASAICPVLKESCDRLTLDKKQIAAYETELELLNVKLDGCKKLISNQLQFVNNANQMEVMHERGKRLKEKLDKKDQMIERQSVLHAKLPELSEALSSLNIETLTAEGDNIQLRLDDISSIIKANNKKVAALEARILEAKRAKEKIDTVVEANQKLQEQLALLNYTCFAFKNIPALEVENSFQEIEDNINYILEHILGGVTVSFSPDRELKAMEPVCQCGFQFPKNFRGGKCTECDTPRQKQRREEITFKILENGIESDFEMDSGGGKQVISYAVRIALTMLKRAQKKCNLNVLFLDEVDSALDPDLAGKVVSSITNFLTKKLGYEQVLLVSHKEQIKSSIPHIIKVTKHDTYSTARFI